MISFRKGDCDMNERELKDLIHEVMDERAIYTARASRKKKSAGISIKKIQTSKALILFASTMYALTWLIAVYSWFHMDMTLPGELMRYSTYLYSVALAVYGGKAAYENKAKIQQDPELHIYDGSEYP